MKPRLTPRDAEVYGVGCDHADGHLRTLIQRNGVKQYKLECQVCGRRGGAIPRAHRIVVALTEDPPLVDETIATRFWDTHRAERQASAQAKSDEWWTQYRAYLASAEWRRRSARVIARDKGLCQAQLPGCVVTATQAHHLTYDHAFNEPLFDLRAVCWVCHEQITHADRQRRAA